MNQFSKGWKIRRKKFQGSEKMEPQGPYGCSAAFVTTVSTR
jgi:hypothetical protein